MTNQLSARVRGIALLLTLIGACHCPPAAAGAEVRDFFYMINPHGADPWVIRHSDGYYYMTVTTGHDVTLGGPTLFSGLVAGEKKVVWTPPASGPHSKNISAPELHYLEGKWYIYYAADNGHHANHRMFVLENSDRDPFAGKFIDKGKIFDHRNDHYAIDGTVLNLKGKLFLIWSGHAAENNYQRLYIAAMSNPWTLHGERVELSKPTHPWETMAGHINEGPQVLIKDETINIVYSASGSWTDHYCLGLLTAKLDSNVLKHSSWTKHDKPVFQSANGVFGPGHCSFVKSPDGKEDWIVYHAARWRGAGWTRNVRTQKFGWHKDGTPRFGGPASSNAPIYLPGGEPDHRRYEAESATLSGTAKAVRHEDASKGAKVGFIDTPESHVEFHVEVSEPGTYNLSVRFGNGTEKREIASHKLSVNGKPRGFVTYENSGWDSWSNVGIQVELRSGVNKIRFTKGQHFAELDCIDIFPARHGEKK